MVGRVAPRAPQQMVRAKAAAVQQNLDTLARHLEQEQRALEDSMGKELGERLAEFGL